MNTWTITIEVRPGIETSLRLKANLVHRFDAKTMIIDGMVMEFDGEIIKFVAHDKNDRVIDVWMRWASNDFSKL